MSTHLRSGIVCALLLFAGTVEAQGPLPDYETCTLSWQPSRYHVYEQTSPTGPAVKVGSVVIPPTGPLTFPCPTVKGTYYYTVSLVHSDGAEGPRNTPIAFTIKGGTPVPPSSSVRLQQPVSKGATAQDLKRRAEIGCPVLAIACDVRTTVPLNVHTAPSDDATSYAGSQVKGAFGTIVDGPVVIAGQPWWKIDYASGVDGWSNGGPPSAPFLMIETPVPVPPPPPIPIMTPLVVTIGVPACLVHIPPCFSSIDIKLVPLP